MNFALQYCLYPPINKLAGLIRMCYVYYYMAWTEYTLTMLPGYYRFRVLSFNRSLPKYGSR
jgi:hypothetical protein